VTKSQSGSAFLGCTEMLRVAVWFMLVGLNSTLLKLADRSAGFLYNKQTMKMKATLAVAASLFLIVGCTSTVTLGPEANKDAVVGATVSTDRVGVTLPLISAETGTIETATTKKKK
jgi:hypothetical protein